MSTSCIYDLYPPKSSPQRLRGPVSRVSGTTVMTTRRQLQRWTCSKSTSTMTTLELMD